jgi:GNAT acetyltransferase-like protein
MSDLPDIQYLHHHEIDKKKWDEVISNADNELIYAYSFYLDHMARHWDALVLNDYEAVMPLTWNKKFGIYYLYQPAFTACLGIFGQQVNAEIVDRFVQSVPSKFKLIEISLNAGNKFTGQSNRFIPAANYVLPLNKSYDELYSGFRENHQRNIQKSRQAGNVARENISIDEVIKLNKQQMKKVASVADEDYDHLRKLYEFLSKQGKAVTYGILSNQTNLLSSCAFFFSHNRAYYILVGNHPEGRTTGASHALIDAFIAHHAGQNLVLDFEGSDIESLALFYAGFGSIKEIYPVIRWNKLPWWLRWAK